MFKFNKDEWVKLGKEVGKVALRSAFEKFVAEVDKVELNPFVKMILKEFAAQAVQLLK